MMLRTLFFALVAAYSLPTISAQCSASFRVLHYTETTGYDHNTRSVSLAMFQAMGLEAGFSVTSDNDGSMFNHLDSLEQFAVIVFSNTSGANGLDSLQRAHTEAYMNGGGSYIGIHAASDTYRHSTANGNSTGAWDWYAETLTGASVQQGPNHTPASHVDTMSRDGFLHPVTDSLPDPWVKQEEYYYWENGYLDSSFIQVLAVDQTGNNSYDAPRMMAQIREWPAGGRSFYTGLGHAPANYTSDTLFYQLIKDAVIWASEPNIPSALAYSLQIVNPQCTNNGFIEVIPVDTFAQYSYLWSTGATTAAIAGLGQGIFTVAISDSAGCAVTDSISLNSVSGPVLQITVSDSISCFGASDGSLTVSFSGGTPPYQFAWANGDTSLTRSNLPSGTYVALVTDSLGCTVLDSIVLADPPVLTASVGLLSPISCFGGSDGAAIIQASGGTGSYAYFWPNGDTTDTRSFLPAGTYFSIVTDENGCTASDSLLLTQPDSVQAGFTVLTPILCAGSSTGSIQANGIGGTAPYSFFWANGDTSATRSGLPAGSYTVTITDQNGCSVTDSISLSDPIALVAAAVISDSISCFGGSDGSLSAQGSGGTGPYSYTWGNGDTSQTRTGLSAGGYFLTVTDANGCTDGTTITISEPPELSIQMTETQAVSCFGGSDGEISITGQGGTGSYQVSWGNGDSSLVRSNLPPGTYFATLIDENGCSVSDSLTLQAGAAVIPQLTIFQDITCKEDSNASIQAMAAGGLPPYSFVWENGDTTSTRTGLGGGLYTIIITDSDGCFTEDSILVSSPPALVPVVLVLDDISCAGQDDASLEAAAAGGEAPYSFNWEDGSAMAVRNNLGPGTYALTVTDQRGCVKVDSVVIAAPDSLTASLVSTPDSSCLPIGNGSITVTPAGGTGVVRVTVFDEAGALVGIDSTGVVLVGDLSEGWYTVILEDNNGCQTEDSVEVADACLIGHSIGELTALSEFVVFRNERDEIQVKALFDTPQWIQLSVYTIQGQEVYTKAIQGVIVDEMISSESLAEGMYYVRIYTKEGQASRSVIVR